jgi:hypothetical protein
MSSDQNSADERAELELLRDQAQRLIVFDGGPELMAWCDRHRLHKDEPYIGCPFCRDNFVGFTVEDWAAIDEARGVLGRDAFVARAAVAMARRLLTTSTPEQRHGAVPDFDGVA